MTLDTAWLNGSPFPDYQIPGLFLAIVNGGLNITSAYGLLRKKWWGSQASLFAALVLVLWIGIQWMVIGYRHWSQIMWVVTFTSMLLVALFRVLSSHKTSRHTSTFVVPR